MNYTILEKYEFLFWRLKFNTDICLYYHLLADYEDIKAKFKMEYNENGK